MKIKRKRFSPSCKVKAGFTLLEVMLALGIFMLAGVSLAVALNQIFEVTAMTASSNQVLLELKNRMAESRIGRLTTGVEDLPAGAHGTLYKKSVELLHLQNAEGQPLPNIYRLTITAFIKTATGTDQRAIEVYVYQP